MKLKTAKELLKASNRLDEISKNLRGEKADEIFDISQIISAKLAEEYPEVFYIDLEK